MHVDPYAKALNTPFEWLSMKNDFVIQSIDPSKKLFNWEKVQSPGHALEELVIYEMHVRAFTQDPSSGVKHPGTFLGVIEKIPHLVELGVNAVELMPIFEFDERKGPEGLCNFWGYDTLNFFCPMNRYGVSDTIYEFKQLVKALHEAGIEVILDVVYNHSSSFEFDRKSYYLLDDKGGHTNYSGCGNTLGAYLPKMRQLILDSLRYWCSEFHVDGFRFDLAATLTRGGMETIEAITHDPIIGQKKLIAEPWDPGGLYMVGKFPEGWAEWDDAWRNSARAHVNFNGPPPLATAKNPIHYIVSHDGFTLRDLVSYDHKHNEANLEDGRDGSEHNVSFNGGVEGDTDDAKINTERRVRMEKLMTLLMDSKGPCMLFMGDEYGHTRRGNNNAWCQDNQLNWFLWDELEKNQGWFDFVKSAIVKRKSEVV